MSCNVGQVNEDTEAAQGPQIKPTQDMYLSLVYLICMINKKSKLNLLSYRVFTQEDIDLKSNKCPKYVAKTKQ